MYIEAKGLFFSPSIMRIASAALSEPFVGLCRQNFEEQGSMELGKFKKRDLYLAHGLTRAYGDATCLFLSLLEFDNDPAL